MKCFKDTFILNSVKALLEQDLDNSYLKPNIFLQFCKELNINPKQLYDEYYSFIFSDCGNMLHQFRVNYHLNQKQLAELLSLSPSDIGLFEKSKKYQSRIQYKKIVAVLNDYIPNKMKQR